MAAVSRRPLLKNLCFLVLFVAALVAGYVLSYAPIYRMRHGPSPTDVITGPRDVFHAMPAYCPVELLLDNTILDKPLCLWADVWGVGPGVRSGILYRRITPILHDFDALQAYFQQVDGDSENSSRSD
jgi:hypothetical protein